MHGLAAPLGVPEFSNLNNVAGWFIKLRWVAAGGVFAVLAAAGLALPGLLPTGKLFALNGVLAGSNAAFYVYYALVKDRNLSKKELSVFFNLQICSDYFLLLGLLYLSGFLENPFAFFFVFHIMLTVFFFPANRVFLYVGGLVAALVSVSLAEYFRLIPHYALFTGVDAGYSSTIIPRAAGVCATLVITGYMGTSIKKRLDERRLQVEIELNRYMSLDKLKSGFILQVTHELRGPLAAVNGFHEMIQRGITGPVGDKTLEILAKATRRNESLLMMIDEMIDYAYMQADTKRIDTSMIPLREVLDAAIDALSSLAEAKGIRFETKCAPGLAVRASRDLASIIASNLLSNAIRYSPAGSAVIVSAVSEGDDVCLEVRDQGIGMSPAELARIFEEFYRTRRAREMERDGTGLGLSIIKKAVESIGGRISVASEVDKGSVFHIYFKGG
jgi:signal transduction histidine kinase